MTIRINGQRIPPAAIEYELSRLIRFYREHMSEAEIMKQMDALKEKAKEQAIGAKLLIDEATQLDLPVPESDIRAKLKEIVETCGGDVAFKKLLQEQGATEETVRGGIIQGRRVDLLVDRLASGLSDPTEVQLRDHFEKHAHEYSRPPRALAEHILVTFDGANETERELARSKIEKIRRAIKEGADFAEQAAMHSDCPSGKQAGGSLGWFSQGMMVQEFDLAVFSMEIDTLSDVLESPFGFHVIHKSGQEAGGPAEFDDVREQVREFLRHVARGEVIAAHVAELRARAVIEEV